MTIEPIIRVQSDEFSVDEEVKQLTGEKADIGAVVTFTGICREEGGRLSALELEHYPGMAEAEMTVFAKQAIERFNLQGLLAIHRYGKIDVGKQIVLVAAASRHRQAAFDGANYFMDYLKTNAPFWKKEHAKNSEQSNWVSARDADDHALSKWSKLD
ncbi:MAG: molybdenum cofactor biosynthesis protein MoaE [Pseudomonadota bacterium]